MTVKRISVGLANADVRNVLLRQIGFDLHRHQLNDFGHRISARYPGTDLGEFADDVAVKRSPHGVLPQHFFQHLDGLLLSLHARFGLGNLLGARSGHRQVVFRLSLDAGLFGLGDRRARLFQLVQRNAVVGFEQLFQAADSVTMAYSRPACQRRN